MQGDHWTPKRQAILRWLRDHADAIAPAYTAMVQLQGLADEVARAHLTAHAARELLNTLPEVLHGEYRPTKPGDVYPDAIDKLAQLWPSTKQLYDNSCMIIPEEADTLIRELLLKREQIAKQPSSAEVLARALHKYAGTELDDTRPLAEALNNHRKWFSQRAHFTRSAPKLDLARQVIEAVRSLEDLLFSFTGDFFEGKRELDVILQHANARRD